MNATAPEYPLVVRKIAEVISVLFHPLFLPVYVGYFFIFILRLFPQLTQWDHTKLMILFGVNYTLLPLVTILLSKALGFVQSFQLKDQRDRILPYIATSIFYFWIWHVFRKQNFPDEVVMFALAVFISASLSLIINIFIKVSMHATAMGVITMLMLILAFQTNVSIGIYLAFTLMITGMVCTARLLLHSHTTNELYAGLAAGFLSQLVAYYFVG